MFSNAEILQQYAMGQRTTTIRLSENEKRRLDNVFVTAFGTDDVAYGAIVSMLCESYLSGEQTMSEKNILSNLSSVPIDNCRRTAVTGDE